VERIHRHKYFYFAYSKRAAALNVAAFVFEPSLFRSFVAITKEHLRAD